MIVRKGKLMKRRMNGKLKLKVFNKTLEAHVDREIATLKRLEGDSGMAIKPLLRLRKVARGNVASLDNQRTPASFDVALTLRIPKGVDEELWVDDLRESFWEVVSGVEYALFDNNWLMGLSRNIIHSHYHFVVEKKHVKVVWRVMLKEINRPCPWISVWVDDAMSDRGGHENQIRLWKADADGLPLL